MISLLLALSATAFAGVSTLAWQGRLGLFASVALAVAGGAFGWARRSLDRVGRERADLVAKMLFTIVGMVALLRYPISAGPGQPALPAYFAITNCVSQVDGRTFATFALVAMLVKFSGVIASATGWYLLLLGQGLRFPFWSQVMTAFLIGRFIGTFLPSTIGIDGYTLYEASLYSNQWARCVTAKLLEKVIGITGLFFGMVLTMPFGYQVIRDVTQQIGAPESAPLLALGIGGVAGGVSLVVVASLAWPALLVGAAGLFGGLLPRTLPLQARSFGNAIGAYQGQVVLLFAALGAKFFSHFATATVYYFTALAIGVVGAELWPIAFGSMIQILATLISPTIAGEGAREAFQALLLQKQLGGVAQAILSGALGFVAAEAATLWGGAFIWTRTASWRPSFVLVDGNQATYEWLSDGETTSLAEIRGHLAANRSAWSDCAANQ